MGGERLRRATPYDYRLWFGVLALTPVLGMLFGKSRGLIESSTFLLWLGLTSFCLGALLAFVIWARFVPAKVSLGLAVITWAGIFYALR
jgi:hypothetical protein